MKYSISEKRALKKLGIEDFRHMSKDKIIKFTSMLPYLDPEVAKAALAQFPKFAELATGVVTQYKNVIDKIIDGNDKSQTQFYNACNKILDTLAKELENDHLSSEERDRIEDKMIQVARMIGEKDSENKNYMLKVMGGFSIGALIVLAVGASLLGSNSRVSTKNDDDDDAEFES